MLPSRQAYGCLLLHDKNRFQKKFWGGQLKSHVEEANFPDS